MEYLSFTIKNYRAIEDEVTIDISKASLIPLVGINECGKTTILQAIYCFDSINDSEYKGRHLKDTKNLYQTIEKGEPIISAKIKADYSSMSDLYEEVVTEYNSTKQKDYKDKIEALKPEEKENHKIKQPKKLSKKFSITGKGEMVFTISRNLSNKNYSIDLDIPTEVNALFAKKITLRTPYILYNDDFMDRVPNSIFITNDSNFKVGWHAIFERLFNVADESYTLLSVAKESDSRRRDAIISDIEDVLNKTLTKAWKTFSLGSNTDITIRLKLIPGTEYNKKGHHLEIKVVDRINTKERYFDIVDRSKGFLWFFNFVMKLEFNPKVVGADNDTVYLLDEPGSYLHYSAQEKLCSKLVKISKKHGRVIYCTHSHTLLNPEHIAINSILVVEKTNQKKIKVSSIANVTGNTEKNTAFQPIHDALQMSSFESLGNKPVLVVEGIYDKYVIQLFSKTKHFVVLPSTSASAIIKNIQYLNGFNKHYIAIWDNDNEGRKCYKEASTLFGEMEAKKFDMLPLLGKDNRKMEQMFEASDLTMIKRELKLEGNFSYEKTMVALYYAEDNLKDKIVKKVSETTKERFKILGDIIDKKLVESKSIQERE